jgi:glycosyltransferase involved in cell wall biosynthesis
MKSNVKVSVVIPTYNRPDMLITLLKSLENQTFKNFEVVVVVDGDDKTANIVKNYKKNCPYPLEVEVIPNSGCSVARNRGISLAKSNIVAFTDDDCVPDNDWLKKGIMYFENSNVVGIEGVIYTFMVKLRICFIGVKYYKKLMVSMKDSQ